MLQVFWCLTFLCLTITRNVDSNCGDLLPSYQKEDNSILGWGSVNGFYFLLQNLLVFWGCAAVFLFCQYTKVALHLVISYLLQNFRLLSNDCGTCDVIKTLQQIRCCLYVLSSPLLKSLQHISRLASECWSWLHHDEHTAFLVETLLL